ncbi:hypothetical protein [Francisella sp. TX07-6608]|uniref:hypothetical protein n=1 Tax=Francisella sp. TX07-6608 TaxID=573568 RepID=UPI0008F9C7DC|nr:hypothetical protein [Francisella sp. TX07-6608]OIN83784.1 hypothetical protein KX00_273 [Francisella sp. TX07-6608]
MLIKEYEFGTQENNFYLKTNQAVAENIDTKYLSKNKSEKQAIGGKNMRGNTNPLPGLYQDKKGNRHYIKIPGDPKEMFCEMFHGALANNLRFNGYLDVENPYISAADGIVVKMENKSMLALSVPILPDFNELFKYLTTAKSSGKERDNWKEITNRSIYSKFVEGKLPQKSLYREDMKLSLAKCVLQSVAFFGDYSLHSSNVALYGEEGAKKIAKIDGGAAFRSFAKNSPINILFPYEYEGRGVHKLIHKNYIDYYTRIPGLKEYLSCIASEYIDKFNKPDRKPLSKIVYESIQQVKEIYAKASKRDPFNDKAFSDYFGIDLSIDEEVLSKQIEAIIYRNIQGFQRIIKSKNHFNLVKNYQINGMNNSHSIQVTILQFILSRGADVKSKPSKCSKKDLIKESLIEKLKSPENCLPKEEFLSQLESLCVPSNLLSFSSKTADTLSFRLSRLSNNDPIRIYLGVPPTKQKISSTELIRYIKKSLGELNKNKLNCKNFR